MLIDGRALAQQIHERIKTAIEQLHGRKPGLTAILVGDNPASASYVATKKRTAQAVGIVSNVMHFPETFTEEELLNLLDQLNQDEAVDGILVQNPLPAQINTKKVMLRLSPEKDVDGFHPMNMGKLLIGESDGFLPCTPFGIKKMLQMSNIPLNGQHVVIIGRSNIVGKPLAAMLMQKSRDCNATVTIVHSQTRHLAEICASADILVAAMGQPRFVKASMVKEGAVVIDVGINRIPSSQTAKGYLIVGDVDFETVSDKCSAITPVPGGVGPMTVAMLLQNTLTSFLRRQGTGLAQSLLGK